MRRPRRPCFAQKTRDRADAWAAEYRAGTNMRQIAEREGITRARVQQILAGAGVTRADRPIKEVKVPHAEICKARQYDRIMARVQVGGPDDCWLWTGGTFNPRGAKYPHIIYPLCVGYRSMAPGTKCKKTSPYRLIWLHHHGEIPEGMTVDHTCWNPLCCNPAHLQLLTARENSARKSPAWHRNIRAGLARRQAQRRASATPSTERASPAKGPPVPHYGEASPMGTVGVDLHLTPPPATTPSSACPTPKPA